MTPLVHDPETHPLGKHLGVVVDPRTLQFKSLLKAAALPPIPRTVTVTTKVPAYPMYGNDFKSDCTCASSAHRLLADTTREGHPIQVTDTDVFTLYDRVNGGVDEGAYMLDVVNALRKYGIGGHKIGAFVKVDLRNWDHVKLGMRLFGGLWLGVALPVTAQRQAKWAVAGDGKTGDAAAGSWGGHAIWCGWVGDTTMYCVTWAEKKGMTKEFVQRYGDEGYFILDPAWLGADARSPQGFNLDALKSFLASL